MKPERDVTTTGTQGHRAWWTGRAGRLGVLVGLVLRTVFIGSCALSLIALVIGAPVAAGLAVGTAVVYGVLLSLPVDREASRTIGILATAVLHLASTYAMCVGQGLHDVGIVLLPLVLIVGSLLLSRAHFFVLLGIGVLTTIGVGIAERWGLLPNALPAASFHATDVVLVPVILTAVGAVTVLLIDHLHGSLAEAEASECKYREMFNATHDSIVVLDRTGRILDVNQSVLERFGITREQALGSSISELTDEAVTGANELALERIERAGTEGPQVFEWHARRSDGSTFWAEVTLRASEIEGRWRVLAVVRDIDARKRRHERINQSEKLEAVGQLAGGVAHDFNNQLTGIMGFADLLRGELRGRPDLSQHVAGILTAADHAADLTAKLLAFARKGRSITRVVDLHAVVREVVTLLTRSIDRRIRVSTELCAERATTLGDPSQLANALLNLGLNARDAMPEGGTLLFRTSVVSADGPVNPPRESGEVPSGKYVRLEVTDTGVGMDGATRARAFEPFYTTKPAGTGMGLAAVYGTVEEHRGTILIDSSPGRGTTVTLLLPLEERQVLEPQVPSLVSTRHPTGLTMLLIEDEPMVAESCRLLAEELGHRVVWCSDAQAGVDTYRKEHDSIDLVLMDLTTPRLTAAQAFDALRAINPDAVIVLYSGYDAGAESRALIERGAHSFLQKPFRLQDLSDVLGRVARELAQARRKAAPAGSE